MTTLESRYAARLQHIMDSSDDPECALDLQVEYILQTVPFIQKYVNQDAVMAGGQEGGLTRGRRGSRLHDIVQVKGRSTKHQVLQEYMAQVEEDKEAMQSVSTCVINRLEGMVCPACDVMGVLSHSESQVTCIQCGQVRPYMDLSYRGVTYDQEVQQFSPVNYFAYKKLNHFIEWLNAFQGRENTEIPEQVLEAVRAEFKKVRASRRADITSEKVRAFLKKLKFNKYYEHSQSICTALGGVPAPQLPPYLEERLKQMFNEIQAPFEKHKPKNRKNFLSYAYVLYKFCELLGEDEYLKYFPLLKSTEKLFVQDEMWCNICKELGWQFIESV